MNLLLSVLFIISLVLLPSGNGQYNVLNFGAKADRKTDSTKSFLGAWAAACASVKPATIHVPRGSYLLGHTVFNGPCKNKRINIRIDGTLVAPSNYAWLASTKQWILFHGVHGISIFGGTLDGRGNGLWTCKEAKKNCPGGATVGENLLESLVILLPNIRCYNIEFIPNLLNLDCSPFATILN